MKSIFICNTTIKGPRDIFVEKIFESQFISNNLFDCLFILLSVNNWVPCKHPHKKFKWFTHYSPFVFSIDYGA